MDWDRVQAALIRLFWAVVFPAIGILVAYFANEETLANMGIEDAALISLVSGILYGLKKFLWPDTVL